MHHNDWFIEIQQPKEGATLPNRIDCYILVNIDPKCCGSLARDLNVILPLRGTSQSADELIGDDQQHFPVTEQLKRIRRRPATSDELVLIAQTAAPKLAEANDAQRTPSNESPPKEAPKKKAKKAKCNNSKLKHRNWSLDMLVGSVESVDNLLNQHAAPTTSELSNEIYSLESILGKYNITKANLVVKSLPGRPAETKEELQRWNTDLWPTLFFEKKTDQFKEEEMQLTIEEKTMMTKGMEAAIQDAISGRQQWNELITSTYCDESINYRSGICGVIVMNPESGTIVSHSSEERTVQAKHRCPNNQKSFPDQSNPLCTPTILAIQGVSRIERHNALGHGMESKEFQRGQYLCTGYDVYLTKEPNAYEAMALVHSRVRRVIFGAVDTAMGGLCGVADSMGGLKGGIHCLPGTNHHYRAFRINMDMTDPNYEATDAAQSMKNLIQSLKDLHPKLK